MDTISLAGTLAFAMELADKGVKDFGLHFGEDPSNIRCHSEDRPPPGEFSEWRMGPNTWQKIWR
jgi:aldehyde:ferredoxin oxidoreductase